jgi:hypothetical protein
VRVVVLAAHRAYVAVKRATRSARPRRVARLRFARRAFAATFVAGVGVLGIIGLLAPSNFGQPGAKTLGSGWPSILLVALVGGVAASALVAHRHLLWLARRVREPLLRPLEEHPAFAEAADALASCPAPLRLRWSLGWVWGPVAWAVVAGTLAWSSAYFVVDAVLARFRVGWGQPLYALVFAGASVLVFATLAGRLATWRFAMSVHKEVTTGYTG